jgi:hypothetical protein
MSDGANHPHPRCALTGRAFSLSPSKHMKGYAPTGARAIATPEGRAVLMRRCDPHIMAGEFKYFEKDGAIFRKRTALRVHCIE